MLWGAGLRSSHEPKTIVNLDGVVVVPGPCAAAWRQSLQQGALSAEQIDIGWQALDKQVRIRDEQDLEPVPRSVEQIVSTTAATVIAAATGVVTAAWLLELVGASWAWAAVGVNSGGGDFGRCHIRHSGTPECRIVP